MHSLFSLWRLDLDTIDGELQLLGSRLLLLFWPYQESNSLEKIDWAYQSCGIVTDSSLEGLDNSAGERHTIGLFMHSLLQWVTPGGPQDPLEGATR